MVPCDKSESANKALNLQFTLQKMQFKDECNYNHVNIIVMGSRGLGSVKEAFLGSVASGISQHSKCPVLIVK